VLRLGSLHRSFFGGVWSLLFDAATVSTAPQCGLQCTNKPVELDYWDFDSPRGFLPRHKNPRHCIDRSLRYLCQAVVNSANDTDSIAQAASWVNATAILEDPDISVAEDAHHTLSIAACRIGVNQNPKANERKEEPITIPYAIGAPLLQLSAALHREPAVGYAAIVLDNCVRRDTAQAAPPKFTDWDVQRTVSTAKDDQTSPGVHRAEQGFYAAHCAVEEEFAPVKVVLGSVIREAAKVEHDLDEASAGAIRHLQELLEEASFAVRRVLPVLKKMRTFINPSLYLILRPMLKCGLGYENGLQFEGPPGGSVNINFPSGQRVVPYNVVLNGTDGLRGPTGAMTSTMSFVDAALGIRSSIDVDASLQATVRDFVRFQPQAHVSGISAMHSEAAVVRVMRLCNDIVEGEKKDSQLQLACASAVDAYDDVVTATGEFRLAHVDHVATYILQNVPSFVPVRKISGTGGTPISQYLCRSAIGTLAARLRPQASQVASVSLPILCFSQCLLDVAGGHQSSSESTYCHYILKMFERMEMNVSVTDLAAEQ